MYLDDGELFLQSCYCLNTVSNEAGRFLPSYVDMNVTLCVVLLPYNHESSVRVLYETVALKYCNLYRFLF